MITLILLIVAFGCFVLAALGVATSRINLLSAGLACWVLTVLLGSRGVV